ncbi:MAG TPA: SDR family oxidoreductase [Flavitalea sp.]|nr:SDR family oxidoreductase [Flavitalea sp.]
MDLALQGKVVVVTGGAKGIGFAIAKALASEGAIPFIIGRNETDNLNAVEEITSSAGKALQCVAELMDPHQCERAITTIKEAAGRIDGVVNNAGVNDGINLKDGSYEAFMASLHKNLIHYYLIAHYALPELIRTKGSIVNITSKVADTGQGGTSAYAASNGGRNALTREWAVELLPFGIRVNAVVVAECWTPLYENWIKTLPDPKQKLEQITTRIPLGKRMTKAEEIAATAIFLLSDRSSHTTGQMIYVDGGYVHLDRAIE